MMQLRRLGVTLKVNFLWVPRYRNIENERADELARRAYAFSSYVIGDFGTLFNTR